MSDESSTSPSAELISAPLGALIAAVGRGVAEAQHALDASTIDSIRQLASGDDPKLELMRKLGYQPTWYRIPEVEAELSVSMSLSASGEGEQGAPLKLYAATVDATYANKYGYSMNAASTVRFKVVAVPATPTASALLLVPRLSGRKLSAARAMLEDRGIPYELAGKNQHPDEGALVTTTTPDAGEPIKIGRKLILVIAGGA